MAKKFNKVFALAMAIVMVLGLGANVFAAEGANAICGKEEHMHTEECIECILEEHIHTEDCFSALPDETEPVVEDTTDVEVPEAVETEEPSEESVSEVIGAARIGAAGYTTFAEAVAAANADTETVGDVEIVLLEDVTVGQTFNISRNIKISGNFTLSRANSFTGTMFKVTKNAVLTLDGGLIIDGGNNWTFDSVGYYADMNACLTLSTGAKSEYTVPEEGGVVATGSMIAISSGCEVVVNEATIQNNWSSNHNGGAVFSVPAGATLTTNKGSVINHIRSSVVGQIAGVWNINDGLVNDVFGQNTNGGIGDLRGGTVNINGGEISNVRTLGLNANGNGILFQVYGESSKLNMSGGIIHNNASFSPGNGWGSVVYLNRGGDFTMTGGVIKETKTDICSAFVSNESTCVDLINGTIVIDNDTHPTRFESLFYGDVTIGKGMEIIGEDGACFVMLGDDGNVIDIDGFVSGKGTMWLMPIEAVTGEGTITSDVLIKNHKYHENPDITLSGANWNCLITVDSIGTEATLIVTPGANVTDGLVRVLESVESADYTNVKESADAQASAYVEEKGAIVTSPVLYYHRLTSAQKKNIVVTYDYNGGLDAQGWSGCQLTTENNVFNTTELPAPTREGYILKGWNYASENDPESLSMKGDRVFAGEDITENVRLIAQWEALTFSVTYKYIGTIPANAPAVPATRIYEQGARVELSAAPTMDGYVFHGWKDTSESLNNGLMPDCNVVMTGYWTKVESTEEPPIGIKTDEEIDGKNNYEVKIEVPGNADATHDEVIIMMDGSYSGDDEWPQARDAILEIGETVLDGSGHTKLSLMAFGMADNMVIRHIETYDKLVKSLPEGGLPGGLLYGRSSTNCEAGFTGVAEYIISDELLNDAYVIYITDGRINTDETPRAFDANWRTYSTQFGALTVAQACFEACVTNGENLPAAFAMFGNRFEDLSREAILESAFGGSVTADEFYAFAEQVWSDVYAYSDLVPGAKYPVSEVETAFVKYDKEHGTYIQDLFYYTTYKSSYVTYNDRWSRTPMAGTELASMVKKLYMIDVDDKTSWMDPANGSNPASNVVGENVSFTQITGFENFSAKFADALKELSATGYTDIKVVDYMSKWVNIDTDSVRIVDDSTGKTIWTTNEGWLIPANERPTDEEKPVIVEIVAPADYANGGDDVVGNTSGDIIKLTWFVKDDSLLRTDNYSLRYTVTVDTEEEGFEPGTSYPANGKTSIKHTKGGNDIVVPEVTVKAYTVTYKNGDTTVQVNEKLKTGDEIPGCATPGGYTYGVYTYYFSYWKLIDGKVGEDGKVGTTDLVYQAVFGSYENTTNTPDGGDVNIEDNKTPLAAVPSVFTDDHFAYIVGYPDGNVRPEGKITRAEVATIFFRLLSDEVREMMFCEENDFSDVNKGYWYNNAISTMAAMGIVEGYPDGTFRPDDFITRAEFAAIAARFELEGNPEGNFFNDIGDHWAEELINIAANNGWVDGYPDGSFCPDKDITRAEAMTMVNRILHRIPEFDTDLLNGMTEWPDNMDKKMWYYLAVQEATNSHDYKRKENPIYETWVDLRENRDWTELEY